MPSKRKTPETLAVIRARHKREFVANLVLAAQTSRTISEACAKVGIDRGQFYQTFREAREPIPEPKGHEYATRHDEQG